MQYDANLIKTDQITINGKKVPIQRIPAGMNGPNGPIVLPPSIEEDNDVDSIVLRTPAMYKEYSEYVDEGIEPDMDEVRAIKDEIEKDQAEEMLDTESLDEDEVE